MQARETSSPPDHSDPPTPAPVAVVDGATPPPANRKRKYAAFASSSLAGSPAPSDPGAVNLLNEHGLTPANVLQTRPRLSVARGPIFVPVSEGSIYHTTDLIAANHRGYRYVPAGLTEPGSKVPHRTIESRPTGCARVSWEDRNPLVKVTTDGLGLCGEKGFRSARLNVPVREGKWYMEVKIEQGGGEMSHHNKGKDGAHVRLGWGRRESQLNCPVGIDGYSYGCRDKTGEKVTLSRPRPYGRPFGSGDVIGMYISLPPKRKAKQNDPYDPAHIRRERIAIDYKGQEYFESVEYPQSKEMMALMDTNDKNKQTNSLPSTSKKSATVKNLPERGRSRKETPEATPQRPLPTLKDSVIAFFVNGEPQGVAFQDIYDYLQLRTVPAQRKNQKKRRLREGLLEHTENPFDDGWLGYYPFISLFNDARVHLNPGPEFAFPPPSDIDAVLGVRDEKKGRPENRTWRPLSERYSEFMAEQWALDTQEEADAQAEAKAKASIENQENETPDPLEAPVTAPPPQDHASTPVPLKDPTPAPEKTKEELDAEAKAAARRERKRISEQKRRARKAEEARAAKAREKEEKDRLEEHRRPDISNGNAEQFQPVAHLNLTAAATSLTDVVQGQEQFHEKFSFTPVTTSNVDQDFETLVPSEWGSSARPQGQQVYSQDFDRERKDGN